MARTLSPETGSHSCVKLRQACVFLVISLVLAFTGPGYQSASCEHHERTGQGADRHIPSGWFTALRCFLDQHLSFRSKAHQIANPDAIHRGQVGRDQKIVTPNAGVPPMTFGNRVHEQVVMNLARNLAHIAESDLSAGASS
jgi:hypothetical protein